MLRERLLQSIFPLKFRRLLVRDSRSRGSGLSSTVDERLEEVSICGRQRLRPHGHPRHTHLECISSLKGVFYGVVEHVSWSRRPSRTSARRGASPSCRPQAHLTHRANFKPPRNRLRFTHAGRRTSCFVCCHEGSRRPLPWSTCAATSVRALLSAKRVLRQPTSISRHLRHHCPEPSNQNCLKTSCSERMVSSSSCAGFEVNGVELDTQANFEP